VSTRGGAEPRARRGFDALLAAYLEELQSRGASRSLHTRARLVLPRLVAHLNHQGVRDLRSVQEGHLVCYHAATNPT
jgi:hypothetical protein